jgi:toxin ParE1/3/4
MKRYLLTDSAKSDILHIAEFLRDRNPRAAGHVCRELRREMRRLAEFPGIGHFRDDLAGHGLRFWSVHSYLIIYRADAKPLQIIRVLHGAQDLGRYFHP